MFDSRVSLVFIFECVSFSFNVIISVDENRFVIRIHNHFTLDKISEAKKKKEEIN